MQLEITHDWEHHWDAQAYLSQYYQTSNIAEDEKAVCQFIRSHLSCRSVPFATALDIGVGPTLHHEIALAPYVAHLDMADFLPQNLTKICEWLEGDTNAHNWDGYIKGILAIEGITSPNLRAVEARKRLLKERINQLLYCNIKSRSPLGSSETYALVTAFYVADSVANSRSDWRTYMSNIANLVEPGGTLLISALRNAQYYRVGNALFPSANINENDVEHFYLSQNFAPGSLEIQVDLVPELRESGFDSIIIALGTKNFS